jgi:hypothetical protein
MRIKFTSDKMVQKSHTQTQENVKLVKSKQDK